MSRNSREFLLVDGYNIINTWPDLIKDFKEVDLETSRKHLIDIMAEYSAMTGIIVVIVFDAHSVSTNTRRSYMVNGVEVVFTKEGETADHYIEKVVDAIGREEKVRVATSDWIEQQIVLGRGALRISARELYLEVKNVMSQVPKEKIYKNDTLGDMIDPKIWRKIEKHINHSDK